MLVGKRIGEGASREETYDLSWCLLLVSLFIGFTVAACLAILLPTVFIPYLYPLFHLEGLSLNIATIMCTVYVVMLPLKSFDINNITGILRAGGDARMASVIDLAPVAGGGSANRPNRSGAECSGLGGVPVHPGGEYLQNAPWRSPPAQPQMDQQHHPGESLMSLFCCPVCGGPLRREEQVLRCPKRHSYDLSREGYVYLLPPNQRHSSAPGDDKGMAAAAGISCPKSIIYPY